MTSPLATIRSYVATGIPEFDAAYETACNERAAMLDAIQAWYEDWDNRYDGDPLRDYEIRMLSLLGKGAL